MVSLKTIHPSLSYYKTPISRMRALSESLLLPLWEASLLEALRQFSSWNSNQSPAKHKQLSFASRSATINMLRKGVRISIVPALFACGKPPAEI